MLKLIRDLDFNHLGTWPFFMIVILTLGLSIFILGLAYECDIKSQLDHLDFIQKEAILLSKKIDFKRHRGTTFLGVEAQVASVKKEFEGLLRHLAERAQVPALLEEISDKGKLAGIEFLSIRLQAECLTDFYIELPIEISVTGGYHQLAEFISNLSGINNIVTLHDFVIRNEDDNADKLIMNISAKAYCDKAESKRSLGIELIPYDHFVYSASGLRSPFTRPYEPDRTKFVPSTPVVEAFKLLGIVEKNGKRWAFIKRRDASIQSVSIGQIIDLPKRRIDNITEDSLDMTDIETKRKTTLVVK